jgi:hypothetical protein
MLDEPAKREGPYLGAAHQAPDVVLLAPVGHVRPPPPRSSRMRRLGASSSAASPIRTALASLAGVPRAGRLCHRALQPIELLLFGAGALAGRLAAFRLLASTFAAGPFVGHAHPLAQGAAESVPASFGGPARGWSRADTPALLVGSSPPSPDSVYGRALVASFRVSWSSSNNLLRFRVAARSAFTSRGTPALWPSSRMSSSYTRTRSAPGRRRVAP